VLYGSNDVVMGVFSDDDGEAVLLFGDKAPIFSPWRCLASAWWGVGGGFKME
jgi:hypothetical protein